MTRKETILALLGVAILSIATVGLTYAYFDQAATISNQEQTADYTVVDDVSLVYTDWTVASDNANLTWNLTPGVAQKKTFKVENTGDISTYYDIYFVNLKNTFTNNELVYTIKNTRTNNTIVSTRPLAYTGSNSVTNQKIVEGIEIASGVTDTYELSVTFLNLSTDQTYNIDGEFMLKLGIAASSILPSTGEE